MSKPLDGYKIGFIGLGIMGSRMARHLHTAGAELHVHNRSRPIIDELASGGMVAEETSAGVVANADIICLSLSETKSTEAVVRELLPTIRPGTLVIDFTTTAVATTRRLAGELSEKGASMVDTPVSGGQPGAEAANLTIMVGGAEQDIARALPILEVVGEKITHMGPSGAGQITKLANQVIVALTIDAVAEALSLAESAGVDPAKVRDALRGGFAESRILELQGQRMIDRDFAPGGRALNQLRDIRNACALMDDCDIELPTLRASEPLWTELVEIRDEGELDHSALIRLFRP